VAKTKSFVASTFRPSTTVWPSTTRAEFATRRKRSAKRLPGCQTLQSLPNGAMTLGVTTFSIKTLSITTNELSFVPSVVFYVVAFIVVAPSQPAKLFDPMEKARNAK